MRLPKGADAGQIVAVRIIKKSPVGDGDWLPVKGDGTIPDAIKGAKAGEWEVRFRDSTLIDVPSANPDRHCWHHINTNFDIAAVRLIKKLEDKKVYPACKGKNCGSTDGRSHSEECYAEHEETTRIKSPITAPPILPISQNEMIRIAGEAMREGTKGGGPVVVCDAILRLMK
jgi:hypothetical protein